MVFKGKIDGFTFETEFCYYVLIYVKYILKSEKYIN